VERFHSAGEARAALEDFEIRFSSRDLAAADLPAFSPSGQDRTDLVQLVEAAFRECFGNAPTRSEIRRLILQGSVQWNGAKCTDPKVAPVVETGGVLRLNKTRAVRIQ